MFEEVKSDRGVRKNSKYFIKSTKNVPTKKILNLLRRKRYGFKEDS